MLVYGDGGQVKFVSVAVFAQNPQYPADNTLTGEVAGVELVAEIVLDPGPISELLLDEASAIYSEYPLESVVLTETKSLLVDCAPDAVGVILNETDPEEDIATTELTLTVITVLVVAAKVGFINKNTKASVKPEIDIKKWFLYFLCIFILLRI